MRTFEIIRTQVFDEKILKIAEDNKQLFELDFAIDWGLTRNPDHFNENVKGNYYIWVTGKKLPYKIPQLRILYHIDNKNEKITLINIEIKKTN